MIKKMLLAAAFSASVGLASSASAQAPITPSPTASSNPSPSPTPSASAIISPAATTAAETGRQFVLAVLDTTGKPVPNGTTLLFENGDIPPPHTLEEVAEGRKRQDCGTATVSGGSAQITAQFNPDCPAGVRVGVLISRPEGWITAGVLCNTGDMGPCPVSGQCGANTCQLWLDGWEMAAAGEAPRHLTIMAIPPNEGVDGSATIQPPATGDASLAAQGSAQSPLPYIAFGVAALLAVSSVGLALIRRRRA